MKLIVMMHSGKRVINIDESTMDQGRFLRQSWGVRGQKSTFTVKPFGFKLSLVAAIDTFGSAYFALSQSNVGSEVFSIFMLRLSEILDAEDGEWRANTVIVVDGAKYHRSEETRAALAALRAPVLMAGPYGYDASPCEKLFAHLKVGDLNPGDIATGKK